MRRKMFTLWIPAFMILCSFTKTAFADEKIIIMPIEDFVFEMSGKGENLNPENLDLFLEENWPSNLVLHVGKNTKFPIQVEMKGELFEWNEELMHQPLEVKKDLFIRYRDQNFLFSNDAIHWKNFSKFFEGNIRASIGFDKESSSPIIKMQGLMNEKRNPPLQKE